MSIRHSLLPALLLSGGLAGPALARPAVTLDASLIQREGAWGHREQASYALPGLPLTLDGEWSQDGIITSLAGHARWRMGTDTWGVSPLVGWRGQWGGAGLQGPEAGIGLDVGFSPQVPSLQADLSAIVGLSGQILPHLRLVSRYRVLTCLDLHASYRLEHWAAWTQVWGVGAGLLF
jgi:hypothetical protein